MGRLIGLICGPVLFVAFLLLPPPGGMPETAQGVAALILWMVAWWISEAVPISVTSLLPLAALPSLGVTSVGSAAAPYADPIIFLMLGGFMIAVAVEKWGLHRRIALAIVAMMGLSPGRLLLGMMLATAFLSMWISNTATVMMMVPLAVAVTSQFTTHESTGRGLGFPTALMLGVAYAGSAGGMATLIGSPPNAIMAAIAGDSLGLDVGFAEWFYFALPLALVFLAVIWSLLLLLVRLRGVEFTGGAGDVLRRERKGLGRMSPPEYRTAAVFALVALTWVARPFLLEGVAPGLTDSTIAVMGAIALFVVPAGEAERGRLLAWGDTKNVNYGILILMGGGLSLAHAFDASGLGDWIATQLESLSGLGLPLVVLIVVTVVVFATEVASNTAIASLMIPLVISLSLSFDASPLVMMAAVAVAASTAFMLPVATPPNAIVFSSGQVTIGQMARTGLALDVFAVLFLTATALWWIPIFLG